MDQAFFERPILNSPYAYPGRHWELDADGQPTGQIIETRRDARFITPIPRPKKQKRAKGQERFVFDEGAGVSTAKPVNNLGTLGRWAFAELTEIYQIEADFKARVEQEFDAMIVRAGGVSPALSS